MLRNFLGRVRDFVTICYKGGGEGGGQKLPNKLVSLWLTSARQELSIFIHLARLTRVDSWAHVTDQPPCQVRSAIRTDDAWKQFGRWRDIGLFHRRLTNESPFNLPFNQRFLHETTKN